MASPDSEPRCEDLRRRALEDPFVRFVRDAMAELGCDTREGSEGAGRRGFRVACAPCGDETQIGHFCSGEERAGAGGAPARGVVLCSDNVERFRLSADHVKRAVLHELIHAYDECRAVVEPTNCEHVACTEVRAALLSGDCDWANEVQRRNLGFKGQGAACARRRAELSVASHAACAEPDAAKRAVAAVFERCYADTAPFLGKF